MDTIEQLANVVSREIPSEEERRDFLRQWEHSSSTRIGISGVNHSKERTQQQSPGLDDDMLNQIQQNFAEYIGPLAGRLVQHYSAETRSLEELVNRLADEIPDPDNRDNFRQHWLYTDICEKWIPCHMQKAPLTRGFLFSMIGEYRILRPGGDDLCLYYRRIMAYSMASILAMRASILSRRRTTSACLLCLSLS